VKPPLEKELKYRLTREEHARLLRSLRRRGIARAHSLTTYLDTPDQRLRRLGIGLRVREADSRKAFLTLKRRAQAIRGAPRAYRVREEYECSLPPALARDLARGKTALSGVKLEPVRVLRRLVPDAVVARIAPMGTMKMSRVKAALAPGFVAELDRFSVFGRKFYELEMETEDAATADRLIREQLKRLRIPYRPASLSKLGRFLAELGRRKGR
jgi:uncharacterized protein YjbK